MKNKERHRLIAEVVASISILSMVVYVGLVILGISGATFAGIGGVALGLYAFLLLMGATKLYGVGVLKAVKDTGGKFFDAAVQGAQRGNEK